MIKINPMKLNNKIVSNNALIIILEPTIYKTT